MATAAKRAPKRTKTPKEAPVTPAPTPKAPRRRKATKAATPPPC